MNNSPLISVIVPVYNVEKYIVKCLTSLSEQTYENFEVLVIDDGSLDESIKLAKEYFLQDGRFIFLQKENGGLSSARNYGVRFSKGEYISFLDSDDYFSSEFLEVMLSELSASCSDIAICSMKLIDENYNQLEIRGPRENRIVSGVDAFKDNLLMNVISSGAQNKLYSRDLVLKYPYPEGLYYEDRATTYKMLLDSKKVTLLAKPLFYYLQREGSIMKGLSKKSIDDRFLVHNLIVEELKNRGIYKEYIGYLGACYSLNVVIAGSHQIAKYSKDYIKDIDYLFKRVEISNITFTSLYLLFRFHKKKLFAFILLMISKRIFRKLVV